MRGRYGDDAERVGEVMAMSKEERAARKAERIESARRIAEAQARTVEIVKTGKCPTCGCGLRRNLALTGWWQCEQFGAEGFRKDSAQPACGWQGFTS